MNSSNTPTPVAPSPASRYVILVNNLREMVNVASSAHSTGCEAVEIENCPHCNIRHHMRQHEGEGEMGGGCELKLKGLRATSERRQTNTQTDAPRR